MVTTKMAIKYYHFTEIITLRKIVLANMAELKIFNINVKNNISIDALTQLQSFIVLQCIKSSNKNQSRSSTRV